MPGCYPTSVQLGLMPLLELERERPGSVDVGGIVADCKSGASGAGRKAEVSLLLSEAADNFKAYGVSGHRHHPEIVQQLDALAGRPVTLTFVPHLVPMVRGIFSTLYVRVTPAAGGLEALQARYERRYAGEPFVDVMPPGSLPETRFVRASNFARIALARGQGDLVIVMVVEDNLVKGAAGQAVQAMNVVCGLPETAGLMQVPVVP
jgi:N-acetyl-gamma-glutamyl-phosphate reductase